MPKAELQQMVKIRLQKCENNMESETKQLETSVGEMHKRVEKMADARRYIIYYTFGDESKDGKSPNNQSIKQNQKQSEVSENV